MTDKTPIIPAAYIGVDGQAWRVRVPVRSIHLLRAEGPSALCGREWTGSSWFEIDWVLSGNQKTAPRSGYDKHDFTITWADGQTYRGRYDLSNDGSIPSLASQVRGFLRYLAEDPRTQDAAWISEEDRRAAAEMLVSHDLQQEHPSPAPEGWPIKADYRLPEATKMNPLDRLIYGLS